MIDLLFRGRTLVFESSLSREEVTKRLQREIAPATSQWYENRPQLFEGTLSDGRFRMVRLVRGRNSFRPVVEGELVATPRGVRIDARLTLHPVVVGLCAILFALGGLVAMVAVSEFLSTREASPQLFVMIWMAC